MATPYIVPKLALSTSKDCKSCTVPNSSNPHCSPLKHRIGTCGLATSEWCTVCEQQLKVNYEDTSKGNVNYPDKPYTDVLRLTNNDKTNKGHSSLVSLDRMDFDCQKRASPDRRPKSDGEKCRTRLAAANQRSENERANEPYWSYPKTMSTLTAKQWAPNRVHEKYLKEVEALRGKLRELRGSATRKLPLTPSETDLSPKKVINHSVHGVGAIPPSNEIKHSEHKVNLTSETKRIRQPSDSENCGGSVTVAAAPKRLREKSPLIVKKEENESPKQQKATVNKQSIQANKLKQPNETDTANKQESPVKLKDESTNAPNKPPVTRTSSTLTTAITIRSPSPVTEAKNKPVGKLSTSPNTKLHTITNVLNKKSRSLSYSVGSTCTVIDQDSDGNFTISSPTYVVGDSLEKISLDDGLLKDQQVPSSSQTGAGDQQSFFRPSLFPYVPPYLRFISHDEKSQTIPKIIQRNLKWKLSSITPLVVRHTVQNSGYKLVRRTNDWSGIWGRHMKSICFKTLKDSQKINHIPGTFQIGRKDRLWKNLYRLMTKFGKKEFGFIPRTFILPQDMKLLRQAWDRTGSKSKWIVKPPASARGTGIKVVHKWGQIPKKIPVIVQKYISNPYLINGNKFDLRLYVLVPTFNPLRIYLYENGLVRFASVKYSDEAATLANRYMHLTNYSINKLSNNYAQNEDAEACNGHKWTIKSLWSYLEGSVNMDALWSSLTELVIKTMISGEASISDLSNSNLNSLYCSYELFGVDVLLDENLKPWLLEVNISPSLHSSSPLDLAVKGPMVKDLLNIAGFQIPNKLSQTQQEELGKKYGIIGNVCFDQRLYINGLSPAEKSKQSFFDKLEDREYYKESILSDLTPDDIRHLILYEDELTQAGDFQKIFPTYQTHQYHQFFEGNRYYNYLFDAWECKYHTNRYEGIKILESKCREQIHLDISGVEPRNANIFSNDVSNNNNNNDEKAEEAEKSENVAEEISVRLRHRPSKSHLHLLSPKYRYLRYNKKKWALK